MWYYFLDSLNTNAYRLAPYDFTFYTLFYWEVLSSGKQRDTVE